MNNMLQNKNDRTLRVTLLANALLLIIGSIAKTADSNVGNMTLIAVFFAWIGVFAWYVGTTKLATVVAENQE